MWSGSPADQLSPSPYARIRGGNGYAIRTESAWGSGSALKLLIAGADLLIALFPGNGQTSAGRGEFAFLGSQVDRYRRLDRAIPDLVARRKASTKAIAKCSTRAELDAASGDNAPFHSVSSRDVALGNARGFLQIGKLARGTVNALLKR